MVLIAAGAALVGASSILYDSQGRPAHARGGSSGQALGCADDVAAGGSTHGVLALAAEGLELVMRGGRRRGDASAPNPLLGDVLVVLAQLCTATQFIIEEKFLVSIFVFGCVGGYR